MDDIMNRAADALAELDRAEAAARAAKVSVEALCREYGEAVRVWGMSPHHLRQAVNARAGRVAA